MTVRELLDVSSFCESVEIIVRKEGRGQWIQGYRVGKNVGIYPSELTAEIREIYSLKYYESKYIPLDEGDTIDTTMGIRLPMKVICKDCHKLPDYIGNLEVAHIQPRYIPIYHKDALTSNDFKLDIDCYPDNYVAEKQIESQVVVEQIDGQMSIEDFLS